MFQVKTGWNNMEMFVFTIYFIEFIYFWIVFGKICLENAIKYYLLFKKIR